MSFHLTDTKMKQSLLENSDALVLLSIIYASELGSKNVGIQIIIGAFDYIEHSIIRYEELNGALCRLNENLYISEVGKLEFLPSKMILDAFIKSKLISKNCHFRKELEFIKELINAKEWEKDFNYIAVNEKYKFEGFSKEKHQLACKNYLGKYWRETL